MVQFKFFYQRGDGFQASEQVHTSAFLAVPGVLS
ncbi:uncharacterized protein METZ01_LOCUS262955, partial [marine metagenome]